jgi:hypothetical protein
MRKLVSICLVILVAASCKNEKLDIDVETVWANYLKQFGDTAEINKVRTVRTVTESTFSGNRKGNMEFVTKDGDKVYMHFRSTEMDAVTKYDGKKFVRFMNGVKEEVSKSEEKGIIRYCDFFHELHYKEHGFAIKLEGTKKINNVETYKVKYYLDDQITFYYIDKMSFKIVKTEDEFQEVWPLEINEINGIRYFSKYKIIDKVTTTLSTVVSIEINPEVNDSIFK